MLRLIVCARCRLRLLERQWSSLQTKSFEGAGRSGECPGHGRPFLYPSWPGTSCVYCPTSVVQVDHYQCTFIKFGLAPLVASAT